MRNTCCASGNKRRKSAGRDFKCGNIATFVGAKKDHPVEDITVGHANLNLCRAFYSVKRGQNHSILRDNDARGNGVEAARALTGQNDDGGSLCMLKDRFGIWRGWNLLGSNGDGERGDGDDLESLNEGFHDC